MGHFNYLEFVLILNLTLISYVNGDQECIYSFDNQEVCNGSDRVLARELDCFYGKTVHICCKKPFRDRMQRTRQLRFQLVSLILAPIGNNCAKRLLCVQSCKDFRAGFAESAYPEVLPSYNSQLKEQVVSFLIGEALACHYKLNEFNSIDEDNMSCEDICRETYPKCDQDKQRSFMPGVYNIFARFFHSLGMWQFDEEWRLRDIVNNRLR